MKILKAVALSGALLFSLSLAETAYAELVAVYGPVYVTKTHRHGHDKETKLLFTAPMPGAGKVIIKNGGDSGEKYRVKSAEVKLNDVELAKERDFKKKVETLTYDVQLKASNELEVEIESCNECLVSITVLGQSVPPAPRPTAPPAPYVRPTAPLP